MSPLTASTLVGKSLKSLAEVSKLTGYTTLSPGRGGYSSHVSHALAAIPGAPWGTEYCYHRIGQSLLKVLPKVAQKRLPLSY